MTKKSKVKERRFTKVKLFNTLIIILPVIICFFFILTPFQKLTLISVDTTVEYYKNESRMKALHYNYNFLKNSNIVTYNEDSSFQILSDEIKDQSLIRTIFNNIFDIPLGLGYYKMCYENIDANLFICRHSTNLKSPVVFTTYKKNTNETNHIYVQPGKKECETHSNNEHFNIIINNRMGWPSSEKIVDYVEKNKIATCSDKYPFGNAVKAKVYIKPHFWLIILKNFLFFLVWSGIILLLKEILNFIHKHG